MPTLGVIRSQVRYHLGESNRPGTWKDEELNYLIWQSCNEHSQRAWSNEKKRYASSIKYVQDYFFPPDFGQLKSIRYFDVNGDDRELIHVTREVLRDWGYRGTEIGTPCAFFREQNSYGLFPIPQKEILFEKTFEGDCPNFCPVLDRNESPSEFYTDNFCLQIVIDNNNEYVDRDGLDPTCVYIGQVGVYLRRKGRHFPGDLGMTFQGVPHAEHYIHNAGKFPADVVNARPDWMYFYFTENPIEVNTDVQEFTMRLFGDGDYQDADPQEYGGAGVEIGVDPENYTAFTQLHRLRNDMEILYYSNYCEELVSDDQLLEIPQRYHNTIVKMTVGKAYAKGNMNLSASQYWMGQADHEIMIAKAQAKIPTLGSRSELRTATMQQPNVEYLGDRKFRLTFGNYFR